MLVAIPKRRPMLGNLIFGRAIGTDFRDRFRRMFLAAIPCGLMPNMGIAILCDTPPMHLAITERVVRFIAAGDSARS